MKKEWTELYPVPVLGTQRNTRRFLNLHTGIIAEIPGQSFLHVVYFYPLGAENRVYTLMDKFHDFTNDVEGFLESIGYE